MKKLLTVVVLLFCFISARTSAQNIAPTWTAIFQGTGDNSDRFNKVIPDGNGNFIGTGYTVKPGNYKDILTVKFKANGDTLWWRTKNGKNSGDDEGFSLDIDAAGNVYVTGTVDDGNTQNDIIVLKYDSGGVPIWDTTWDSQYSLNDVAVELKVDINGDVIVGGNSEPDTFSGSSDYITLKYAANGALDWASRYANSSPGAIHGKDELKGIALDQNGDVYVTGRSFNGADDDIVSIKYLGVDGTQSWLIPYNSGDNDRPADIAIDNTGNVIVAGHVLNGSSYDLRTNKYNNAGLIQWSKAYGSPAGGDDDPIAIAVDAGNNIIIASEADVNASSSVVDFDFQIVKYDASGTLVWQPIRIGNTVNQNDVPTDVTVDASGNIYVTGKSDNSPSTTLTDNDYMTVAYTAGGTLMWGPVYHHGTRPNDDDIPCSVIALGSDVYVAGSVVNDTTMKDLNIMTYNQPDGTELLAKDINGIGDFSASARKVVVDANNNSYAAGYAFDENHNYDAAFCKIDPSGNVQCTYIFNGIKNDDDEFNTLAISSNGMIYAAGYTKVSGQKRNMLLVKYDPSVCDTVWTRTYDYIGQSDRAEAMVLDAPGNIYITGRSDSDPGDTLDNDDMTTIKYDANGVQQWVQRFDGSGHSRDEPAKIIFDNNGDLIVAGRSTNVHDDEFITIKYNSSTGNPVWANPSLYNSPFSNDDRINDVAVDGSNNIFVCGFSQTASGQGVPQDPVVLKYDASGNMQGFYSYTGDDQDEATRIAVDQSNRVYVFFKYDNDGGIPAHSNFDFYLQRFANDLTIDSSFTELYDSPIHKDDTPGDLTISSSGDIYITGNSNNDTLGGSTNQNWVTIGYDASGVQIFISNYDGPSANDDSPNSLIIYNNHLWVAGYTTGLANSQKDLTVNNYDLNGVGVADIHPVTASNAYPNPFSNECLISVGTSQEVKYTIDLFDMMGHSVRASENFTGSTYHLRKGTLEAGVYQYRIKSTTGQIANGRLIIN